MSRFEDIQTKLENLSPIPVNMPKLYLLGDTGAGKTTIVKKILGTNAYKFPSVLQKRCTVAVTEYVLCKDLPYKATYIFKNEEQVNEFVKEILEISIEKAYLSYRKKELSRVNVAEDIEETPDERFRLKYILSAEQLEDVVNSIVELLPYLDKAVDSLKIELQSKEEEIGVVVDLALEQNNEIKEILDKIKAKIFDCIKNKVSELCEGFALFSDVDFYQHSSADIESFVEQAKKLLSSAKNSISPVVEYARLQGNLLADWLPAGTELVLIDGEGIGHDTREASRLSARHLDYFYFADSIGLVEECKKPFASGGKSAIDGIIRNGYSEKFNLIFAKLDEVEVGDDVGANREEKIRAVKKGFSNVINALKEDGVEISIEKDHLYYLSNMKDKETNAESISEINRLLANIKKKFDEERPQFVEPVYDYEMLSSYLTKSSKNFTDKWVLMLNSRHWQTVKAFNRRMCWEWDEFRDMKPVSDFHSEVTMEIEYFISHPSAWKESATPSMRQKSVDRIKQSFSKQLLAFARLVILKNYDTDWDVAMSLSGTGSATFRKTKIQSIIQEVLPDHRKPEAIKIKDSIKKLLIEAIEVAKA
jgi:hypothetical protein